MKDSLVRHWAQRAQMALDAIDTHSSPRRQQDTVLLEMAIDEVRTILCRLAGAATAAEAAELPIDLDDIT